MSITKAELIEAIELGASCGDNMISSGGLNSNAVSSKKRVAVATNVIRRFLESLPNDALSIREIMEQMPEQR